MSIYILPVLMLILMIISKIKKVDGFNSFVNGSKEAVKTCVNMLPYLGAIFLAIELFTQSGLAAKFSQVIAPVFGFVGIPKELSLLVILKPFSGSGSLATLSDIFTTYGPDSYISRCASCIMAASDTLFFITAVYFANTKVKKFLLAIPIALIASFAGAIIACLLCRIM